MVKTFHGGKLAVYAILSLADLLLTYHLVRRSGGQVYESNPIASAWLSAYGWAGLIAFKLVAMLLFGSAASVVGHYRPRAAGHLLTFACLAVACVVGYSCWLTGIFGASPAFARETAPLEQRLLWLDSQLSAQQDYEVLLNQLARELIAGRSTLKEAVAKLENLKEGQDPVWLKYVRKRYPERSDEECLTAELVEQMAVLRKSDQRASSAMRNRRWAHRTSNGWPGTRPGRN